ncbi:hypothetical protein FIBSPDRAFT_893733 [Athelia psychrophila]|uniref:Uncharacterized protein n=1 Tax=Athelia psychrophila TaxID=1759441 RepID=A0A166GV47_9AGAM|nr:hypothetical protein FIBSPDRAFT_893733 [Fibularhizoctonia sp. CBS 109695]
MCLSAKLGKPGRRLGTDGKFLEGPVKKTLRGTTVKEGIVLERDMGSASMILRRNGGYSKGCTVGSTFSGEGVVSCIARVEGLGAVASWRGICHLEEVAVIDVPYWKDGERSRCVAGDGCHGLRVTTFCSARGNYEGWVDYVGDTAREKCAYSCSVDVVDTLVEVERQRARADPGEGASALLVYVLSVVALSSSSWNARRTGRSTKKTPKLWGLLRSPYWSIDGQRRKVGRVEKRVVWINEKGKAEMRNQRAHHHLLSNHHDMHNCRHASPVLQFS